MNLLKSAILCFALALLALSNNLFSQNNSSCTLAPGLDIQYDQQLDSLTNLRIFSDTGKDAEVVSGSFYSCDNQIGGRLEIHLESIEIPNAGWDLELTLGSPSDWDNWSNQDFPTSYRDDSGTVEDEYLSWFYYIIESGSLSGWGEWEGAQLNIAHSPSNHFFGFEVGINANDFNPNFGAKTWMLLNGSSFLNDSDTLVEDLELTASLNLDFLECLNPEPVFNLPALPPAFHDCSFTQIIYSAVVPSENNSISAVQTSGCPATIQNNLGEPLTITNLQPGLNEFEVMNEDLCGNVQERTYVINILPCTEDPIICSPFSAGPDKFIVDCGQDLPFPLQAEKPCSISGTWELVSGGFIAETSNPNSLFSPEFGINTLVWKTTCNGVFLTDTVIIELLENDFENPTTGSDLSINLCNGASLELNGNEFQEPINPFWVQQSGPSVEFSDPFDAHSLIQFTEPGEYVFRWQYIDLCGSLKFDDQTVSLIPDPLNQTIDCSQTTTLEEVPSVYELNGLTLGDDLNGEWSIESESILIIDDEEEANTTVTALTFGTHIFTWNLSNPSCLTQLNCYDTLIIEQPQIEGCLIPLALNYNPAAEVDDGSCLFDFDICDCSGTTLSPYTVQNLGDGTPNLSSPNFNCAAWNYDCGDIEDAPVSTDIYDICSGSLPLQNGCACFHESSTIALGNSFSVTDSLNSEEVCYSQVLFTPTFSGGCLVEEFCFKLGDNEYICSDLPSQGSFFYSGDQITFETSAHSTELKVYYKTLEMTSDTTSIFIPECTTSVTSLMKPNIQLWPNPSNGIIYLKNTEELGLTGQIAVSDMLGKKVFTSKLQSSSETSFDLSHLNSGSYFVILQNGETETVFKERIILKP